LWTHTTLTASKEWNISQLSFKLSVILLYQYFIAEALAREQARDLFISKQCYKILKMKQQAADLKSKQITDSQTIKK
jgi:hypothetical protein